MPFGEVCRRLFPPHCQRLTPRRQWRRRQASQERRAGIETVLDAVGNRTFVDLGAGEETGAVKERSASPNGRIPLLRLLHEWPAKVE